MRLSDVKKGNSAIVEGVYGSKKLKKRLMALGCIKGTLVTFKHRAPLGDPIIINFRGFDLALRKKDAEYIIVW